MKALLELAKSHPTWLLEEFVSVVNEHLPQVLPTRPAKTKVPEEVNPRLVRHYTSLQMLDEPKKSGKYALYTYRHLLQILAIRRLLAEGIGTKAIEKLVSQKSNAELEEVLAGGVQLRLAPTNPALTYLEQLRPPQANVVVSDRANSDLSASGMSAAESAQTSGEETYWVRLEVVPGLELHLRSDYLYPPTPDEQFLLNQQLEQKLKDFTRRSKKSNP